jgi:hypothetical protein
MEELKLTVFENKVFWRIFGLQREEITGGNSNEKLLLIQLRRLK